MADNDFKGRASLRDRFDFALSSTQPEQRELEQGDFSAHSKSYSLESPISPPPVREPIAAITTILTELSIKTDRDQHEKAEMSHPEKMTPIQELFFYTVEAAYAARATDIHLDVVDGAFRIRFRIDRSLIVFYEGIALPVYEHLLPYINSLSTNDLSDEKRTEDNSVMYYLRDRKIRLRLNRITTASGEKLALRLLDGNMELNSLSTLGISRQNLERIYRLADSGHGAVIIAGPVNSGKTTTLYALMQEKVGPDKNIISIEDPIEYKLNGVGQVKVTAAHHWEETLRASLRQDTDLLVLGEIRDGRVAELLMTGAMEGHLVFSTLHTATAAETVLRLMDMGVKKYLIAANLKGVVAQRLVRRLCPKCKERYKIGGEEIYRAGSCDYCNQTGYRGLLLLQEVLMMSETIADYIRQDEHISRQKIEDLAVSEGMLALGEYAYHKLLEGELSLEEIAKNLDYREIPAKINLLLAAEKEQARGQD